MSFARERWLRSLTGWGFAVALVQFMNGTIETSLTPHYPELQRAMGSGPAALGAALAFLPVGLFAGAPVGTWIAKRWGSRAAILAGGSPFFALPPLIGLVPALWWFAAIAFWFGFGNGILDVGYGLQATGFEHRHRAHPVLGNANLGFQSLFSDGSLVGAALASLALARGWPTFGHMAVVGAVALAAMLLTVGNMPAAPEVRPDEEATGRPAGRLRFATLCAASLVVFIPLGATYAWSTPYLLDRDAAPWLAAFGLVAYTLCESLARKAVLWWLAIRASRDEHESRGRRQRRRYAIVAGGGLTALGGTALIGLGRIDTAIAGFGLLAVGLAPAAPIIQSVANESARTLNRAFRIGVVTVIGYLGGVIGQPLIGGVTALTTLRAALPLVLGVCVVAVLAAARAIREA